MKKIIILMLALSAINVHASDRAHDAIGCRGHCHNVGEPTRYRADCGEAGSERVTGS